MKKKFLRQQRWLLFFILIAPLCLIAQKKEGFNKQIFISGTFNNAIKIQIRKFSKYYLSLTRLCITDYNPEVINGSFNISLSEIDAPTYVSIIFFSPEKIMATDIGTYLVEPGDSIFIKSVENKVSFSGKSAALFQCQYEMKLISDSIETQRKKGYNINNLYPFLTKSLSLYDSLIEKKIAILKPYQLNLSKKVYPVLYEDCIYEKLFQIVNSSMNILHFYGKNTSIRKEIIQFYNDNNLNKKADTQNISSLLYSKNYTEFLYWKTFLDSWIKINQYDSVPKSVTTEMYREIMANYNGKLKEKLLIVFFSDQYTFTDSLSLLAKNTLPQIKDPALHAIMEEIQRKTKGTPAYNFSLQDSSGKTFLLADFRGKTVVLDFWYTGCRFCPVMAKMIKPIAEEKDTSIVFISVSVDKNKDKWKGGLKSGIYSSDDELNLYTEGMGLEHPLIKYYSINAYPSVYIIDPKGKLSSINPALNTNLPADIKKLRQAIIAAKQDNK